MKSIGIILAISSKGELRTKIQVPVPFYQNLCSMIDQNRNGHFSHNLNKFAILESSETTLCVSQYLQNRYIIKSQRIIRYNVLKLLNMYKVSYRQAKQNTQLLEQATCWRLSISSQHLKSHFCAYVCMYMCIGKNFHQSVVVIFGR